ncbi:MAG: protein kinase, partial [Anaerolineales bacterium]|nr:protein kinase [Anaerolineales bacterium]
MNKLSISLFGPVQVFADQEEITEFRMLKVRGLLVYLAADPAHTHRRETLMEMLWPGMPETSARGNLRQVLFHLRQAIPDFAADPDGEGTSPLPVLIANRQWIQFNPQADIQVDVVEFKALLRETQAHDHVDLFTCHTCRDNLKSAVDLYRGDFLEDFYLDDSNEFEEWSEISRQSYRRQVLDALETLTAIAIRQNVPAEARQFAERQLEIDNLRESAYRQLMEILALNGQRAESLSLYETCRRILMEELGMAPTARTTELYEKIRAGDLSFEQPPDHGVRGYDIKEELGSGVYGTIHRGVQSAIGREVAIKIIIPRYANDPAFIRRFEAEAQTIARLEHPHIVPLYDYWREPGGAYLVMRLLRGGNLLSALEAGPWDPSRIQIFLDQIAPALDVAHRQGIVHRDIKPANFLFDESRNVYLSDFGIAKDLSGQDQLTLDGTLLGTPDYTSPEQLQEGPVSPQSDIYSLGAVVYEMLTGEKPYPERSVVRVIQNHLSAPFPLAQHSIPDLPLQIDDVIQRATAKDPGHRYGSALELAEDFRRAAQGGPVARPAISRPPDIDPAEAPNPYKGLRPFAEADAADFFGREALVGRLVDRLAESRFLAVVGPSGSGKSSAVRAGLIPALRGGALPGSESWFVAEMVPGTHPLEELELALWPVAIDPPPNLVDPMERDARGMLRTIRRILPDEENARLLLVIDQFEEL